MLCPPPKLIASLTGLSTRLYGFGTDGVTILKCILVLLTLALVPAGCSIEVGGVAPKGRELGAGIGVPINDNLQDGYRKKDLEGLIRWP